MLKRRERVGKAARVEMLGRVSLFESLTRRQLQAVAALADDLVVDDGAVIVEQDTDGDQFFVVVSGGLTVRRNGRKVATCGPGDCVGEMSLVEYQELVGKLFAAFAEVGANASEPELVAEVIYTAATDGTDQLRYTAGADAVEIVANRKAADDATFMAGLKAQLGL